MSWIRPFCLRDSTFTACMSCTFGTLPAAEILGILLHFLSHIGSRSFIGYMKLAKPIMHISYIFVKQRKNLN